MKSNLSCELREILFSEELSFLMEAHNGISAKIVEETGFRGIWASGLTISASLGVRDANEASWTQVLDIVGSMSDAVNIPILLDGDTGYGNFNNVRRLVRSLCQRGIAGVCLEDKLFPKANSFAKNKQKLASVTEFVGKIKAAKDAQTDANFCVVARTEALIAGLGMQESLIRVEQYSKAGADAVLIHSKRSDASEILDFMKNWQAPVPVIVIPTTYYQTPTDEFRKAKVSTVIWANQNLRGAVQSMRQICEKVFAQQSLVQVEKEITSIADIFQLLDYDELLLAEQIYLPPESKQIQEFSA